MADDTLPPVGATVEPEPKPAPIVVARGRIPLTPEWAEALEGLEFVDVKVDAKVAPALAKETTT